MKLSSAPRLAAWLPILLVLAAASAIYFWKLGYTPILGGDEARFGVHAYSIATTGHDLDGQFMPLLFRIEELGWWYQPALFYLIAAVLKFLPLAAWSIRIPTAIIGIVDAWLLYVVARRLFPNVWYAVLGAVMLALTPAHLIFSRQARDYIVPLPFVLGWLWCFMTVMETGNVWLAAAGGLLLGVGFYGHFAAWALMPFFVFLACISFVVWRKQPSLAAATGVGFALPLVMVAIWLRSHPGMVQGIANAYQLYDTKHLSPLQGAKDLLNYNGVQERISVYWDYFNPAYLFFSGGSNLTGATRRAGVFLLPLAVFLGCGIVELWKRHRSHVGLILLAGFFAPPVLAAVVDSAYSAQRELFVLPFAVLISLFGVALLLRRRHRVVRAAAVLLLLAMPVQYAFFFRDYLTDYRVRAAGWFDSVNFPAVTEYVVSADAASPVAAVYMSNLLDDGVAHWRFHLARYHREDLWQRTRFFAPDRLNVADVPPGSLLVFYATDPKLDDLVRVQKCCTVASVVLDPSGGKSAVILRKTE